MEDKSSSNSWIPTKKFFPEAVLVALMTGVGYLAAFTYQYGYLDYFGAPVLLVDVSLNSVLLTTSIGLIIIILLGFFLNTLLTWKSDGFLSKFLRTVFILFLFIVIALLILPASFLNSIDTTLDIILIVIMLLSLGVIIYLVSEGIQFKKIEKNKNDLIDKVEEIYGSFPVLFVLMLFLFVLGSNFLGKTIAEKQTKFLVSEEDNSIIIGTYSNNFITTSFDLNTKTLSHKFRMTTQEELSDKKTVFNFKEVGPFKRSR